jgi:predicted DNA-binding protein
VVFKKRGDTMNAQIGRPKSKNPKSTQLAVRLDKEMLQKLDKVAENNSETRVQTIRRGIDKLYSELKK